MSNQVALQEWINGKWVELGVMHRKETAPVYAEEVIRRKFETILEHAQKHKIPYRFGNVMVGAPHTKTLRIVVT